MVIVAILINVVLGGFSGENLNWLAQVTVRLRVSDNTIVGGKEDP